MFDLLMFLFCSSAASLLVVFIVGLVCVCRRQRAVFRYTTQRRRGRLDRGCIRLVTKGVPSGSLWEDGKEM